MTDDVGVCVLYACILQLHSAFTTITSLAQSVGYFQLVQQLGPARTLDGGDVDEDVHAAILWCDKTKSFGGVNHSTMLLAIVLCLASEGTQRCWLCGSGDTCDTDFNLSVGYNGGGVSVVRFFGTNGDLN